MKKIDLSNCSTKALEAELAKRRKMPRPDAGADWYYLEMEIDDEVDFIGIVHKRFWHRHHCLLDTRIADLVTLPEGFDEVTDSTFDFTGDAAEAVRLLESCGFQKVKLDNSLVVHICRMGKERGFRLDIHCDTPEMRAVLEKRADAKKHFADLDEYRAWAESLVPKTVFETFRPYDGGASGCFMKRSVAKALPPYPDGIDD